MNKAEKIQNLEITIKRHEYNFYVLGEKTISSPELEVLKVELYNLKNMKSKAIQDMESASGSEDNGNLFEFYDGI
jgi:NAD-dependent DNA ligase